jgi:chromosomal replication initiator protein
MNAQQAWQAAQGQLQMELSKATYDTWVKQTQLIRYDEPAGIFHFGASNAYACDWLESRLKATLINKLSGMMARPVEVVFSVWAAQVVEQPADEVVVPLRPRSRAGDVRNPPCSQIPL